MLKSACKLCGAMVSRTRRRKSAACSEENADDEFKQYRLIDRYYIQLVVVSGSSVLS